jgi:hypothetical protein
MVTNMSDKEKRDNAVDAFAKEMKKRLDEKAEQGYTGWDGEYPDHSLMDEIFKDVLNENYTLVEKSVDIANRLMMLWYRDDLAKGDKQ